jgi:DNA polymerase (family X)
MRHELNGQIAEKLRQMADLLEVQGEGGFRVSAYRRAAATVDAIRQPLDQLFEEGGRPGLVALPTIGEGIAGAIAEMVLTGRWAQLDRLTGALEPERLFQTIPGIGPKLAERLHDELDVDTLEQLEIAAHDGRLERVPGVGARRAAGIRAALEGRLARRRLRVRRGDREPPVSVVLSVDESYRRKAAAEQLKRIAPKRFNPSGEAWLPVLHESRGDWRFTALFSNTLSAHQLGKTNDWVVLYFHTDHSSELQCTVVTETRGPLRGKRVVRGREEECAAYYAERSDRSGGAASSSDTAGKP